MREMACREQNKISRERAKTENEMPAFDHALRAPNVPIASSSPERLTRAAGDLPRAPHSEERARPERKSCLHLLLLLRGVDVKRV